MKIKRFSYKSITIQCFTALALLAGACAAHAQTILNNSFETDSVSTDGGFNTTVTSWTTTGSILTEVAETHNPDAAEFSAAGGLTGTAPGMSGPQVLAFDTTVIGGSASASQTTSTDLALNKYYTLTVAVGNPADCVFQGYDLSILAGSTTLATTGTLYNVTNGTFQTESVGFLANSSFAAYVNDPLTIELTAPSAPGLLGLQFAAVDYDNVQFTVAAVPEPSSCPLLLASSLAAWIWNRRFRRVGASSWCPKN
jgi:hypothetical protein